MICTIAQYRAITGDTATLDASVTEALTRAQERCEELTERVWEQATLTETLTVHEGGYVYPRAYPVTAVSAPVGAVPVDAGVFVGPQWATSPELPATVAVSYTGGYTSGTMPAAIVEAVAELAHYKLHPPTHIGVPAGATSVGTSGQNVSGPRLAGAAGVPPSVADVFRRWKHVDARLM